MTPLTITKMIADVVVSAGAAAVVGNAIKASTPATLKTTQKVSIAVGGFVLSSMVGAAASKHTSEQIDTTLAQIQGLKAVFKKKTN